MQNLSKYALPPDWNSGAPFLVCTVWFCIGAPLLSARWIPGSAWRVMLLRAFGTRIGIGCRLKPGLRIKFPWRLQVGNACWLAEDAWIDNLAPVILGDRVCLSQGAYLCTGNHNFRSPSFDLLLGPITIDSDAWIAAHTVVAPGTHVGSSAVVALGAVVNGNVPSGSIVRGNPAVIMGTR
jgi:putative colanic acid biosynthesis acetyltransferase WcaF